MKKNSTILIKSATRDHLKQIGRKNQTYDQLITELIKLRYSLDPLESGFKGLQSSGSGGT